MRRPTRVLLAIVTVILAATAAGCSSSSSTSSTPSSGAGAGNPSKETFCALLVAFRAANDSLDADVNSGDAARSEAAVKRLVSQAKTLQDRAPTDIRADVDVAVTFLDQLEALLAQYSYDITKLSDDPTGAEQFTTLNSDTVQASLGQLRAYGDTDCVDVTTTTTTTAP